MINENDYWKERKKYEESFLNRMKIKERRKLHKILFAIIKIRNFLLGYRTSIIEDKRITTEKTKIYAITHICKQDIEIVSIPIKEHFYLLSGDFKGLHKSLDGLFLELNGIIYFCEEDWDDRKDARSRMTDALHNGGNLMYFPEGSWNLTENLLVLPLFPGIYDVAKETNSIVIPIAMEQYKKNFVINIGSNIDIQEYEDKNEFIMNLRNAMATLKWEIYEDRGIFKRKNIVAKEWEQEVEFRVRQWSMSMEYFKERTYRPKDVVTQEEAFAPIRALKVSGSRKAVDICGCSEEERIG